MNEADKLKLICMMASTICGQTQQPDHGVTRAIEIYEEAVKQLKEIKK
jgi:hypothetical protein